MIIYNIHRGSFDAKVATGHSCVFLVLRKAFSKLCKYWLKEERFDVGIPCKYWGIAFCCSKFSNDIYINYIMTSFL